MKLEISDIEKDIIREIANMGLAKTGDSLAAISGDKVLLSVPDVQIIESNKLKEMFAENNDADIIIQSDIRGDLGGKCILLFHKEQIGRLCKACLTRVDGLTNEVEMKISLLLEVSNILTGALITQLANVFDLNIHGSPPDYILGTGSTNPDQPYLRLVAEMQEKKPFVFIVKTHFRNSGQKVELPLLLIFDIESLQKMVKIIREKVIAKNKYIKPIA